MKKNIFIILLFLTHVIEAQETPIVTDSIAAKTDTKATIGLTDSVSENTDSMTPERKFFLGIDFTNCHIWRGQTCGGSFFAIQPCVEYSISDKFIIGAWASNNFKENVYLHNQYGLRGYKELELYVNYTINDYLTVSLHDYYSPIKGFEGDYYNNAFFYYGESSATILDLNINFDFSEKGLPLSGILSTYVIGNDYRYDTNDENPKQNFTTYFELSYTLSNFFEDFELSPIAGVVFNNAAQSYVNADYDKPSLINLRLDAIKTYKLSDHLHLPVSISYIHNAASRNTKFSGRNFFQATLSLAY